MKIIKNLKKLKVKSEPELIDSIYKKRKIDKSRYKNAKEFSNVKKIDKNGVIHLKTNEYAYLYSVQAVDLSLSSSKDQEQFYEQLRRLYLLEGVKLKQYKMDRDLNFNDISEALSYRQLEQSNNENRSKILQNEKEILESFISNEEAKSAMYFWVVIADTIEKLKENNNDIVRICSSLSNPIYLRNITNYLEIKLFLQELYFQNNGLDNVLYNDLEDSIIPRTIKECSDYIAIDDYFVQLLSIRSLSPRVRKDFINGIYNMPGVRASLSIYDNFDTKKFEATLDFNYKSILSDQYSSKKLSDQTTLAEQNETMQRLMYDLKNDQEKIKTFTLIIAIYAKNLKELNEKSKDIKSYCSNTNVQLDICRFRQMEAWQSFDLTSFSFEDYSKPLPTSTISASFAQTKSFFLDPGGFCLGFDYVSGLPIYFNPFITNKDRVNYNIAVLGTSGSGKTFSVMKQLLNLYAQGAKIIILDIEGEYKSLVEANNGHAIDLYSTSGGMINPLQVRIIKSDDDEKKKNSSEQEDIAEENLEQERRNEKGFYSPLGAHLGYLESFFKTAFEEMTDMDWIVLSKILVYLYETFGITINSTIEDLTALSNESYPIFDDLISLLKQCLVKGIFWETEDEELARMDYNNQKIIIGDLKIMLDRYASGFDKLLFNGHTNINLDNDIICFDLHDLFDSKNDRLIKTQTLSLLSFLNNIVVSNNQKNIEKNLNNPVVVTVDEIHKYKEYSVILFELEQLCRRLRKYLGLFIFATQSVGEMIDKAEMASSYRAIFDNCQYQFIGKLSDQDLIAYKTLFENRPLTDTQLYFLSISTKGSFLLSVDSKLRLLVDVWASDFERKLMKK